MKLLLSTFLFFVLISNTFSQSVNYIKNQFDAYLLEAKEGKYQFKPDSTAGLDTLFYSKKKKKIVYFLSKHWEYTPIRKVDIEDLNKNVRRKLGSDFQKYDLLFFVGTSNNKELKKRAKKNNWPIVPKNELKDLIPNYYRYKHEYDLDRQKRLKKSPIHVKRIEQLSEDNLTKGLYGRHLAIWNSHGWYYEKSLDRWEWQRARLFQTVEDLLPTAFVLPYLVPMLENAGANVYLPRERDTQSKSLIIDNDGEREGYQESEDVVAGGVGFLHKRFYNIHENPFQLGTTRKIKSSNQDKNAFSWQTKGRVKGKFGVYVSYEKNDYSVDDAKYVVKHKKQQTTFIVNQKIGFGTWVYLGTFDFDGSSDEGVYLSSHSKLKNHYITADAVRFGGGDGNIIREGSSSFKPRFMEAARYNLQYSGAPEFIYSLNNNENDYKDDYQSRGEWVNWLTGADLAINSDIENEGLGIPIDMSLALHTDAGMVGNDSTVGTLAIYSTTNMRKSTIFPEGQSRLTNRDLADIIQTQIVEDLRVLHDSTWNRRDLWDKRYSEVVYPEVPSVLIELLSHQNFKDMRFALDPVFRFNVSRSIYKGILRFLSTQNNQKYVVQPLPPNSFSLNLLNEKVEIEWEATVDPLESTSIPKYYKLYTNINNQGWNNGEIIQSNKIKIDVEKGDFYSFKVTAINEGGESFSTEELSMANFNTPPILIVNAFDRLGPPSFVETESYTGFTRLDHGIADQQDISFTGFQYDFNPDSPWIDDDAPGFGASYGNLESVLVKGNTFNYTKTHGEALFYLKKSFVSCSRQALEGNKIDIKKYKMIDFVFGEQKDSSNDLFGKRKKFKMFSDELKIVIEEHLKNKGKIFISGAYVGSELFFNEDRTPKGRKHPDVLFGKNILHMIGRTDYADLSGEVYSTNKLFKEFNHLKYSKRSESDMYIVESPDAIEPFGDDSNQICRYKSNNKGAGITYKNQLIILGFPFESILNEEKRILLMEEFLNYFQ